MPYPHIAPVHARRILAASTAALIAFGAMTGCSAIVDRTESTPADSSPSEPAAGAGTSFDLTSKNVDGRPHTDPIPEAVQALEESGFTPVQAGKLTVAHLGAGAPPITVFASDDNKTIIGSDPDFASLIAEGLGLEYAPENVSWADWPLGTESGKYDASMINITVTEERKKLFDFATYREDVVGFEVKADSDLATVAEAKDIAGLTVGVGSGTNQEQILLDWVDQQQKAGLEPTKIVNFDDQAAADLALKSGRIDSYLGPNAGAAYAAAVTGEVKVVGTLNGGYPDDAEIAVTTAKDNGLIEPVQIVIDALIENGQYQQVLDRWGQQDEGVEASEINPPGLKG